MNAPLTYLYRELARSLQYIKELRVKNSLLLQALKDLATSPNLDLNESARVNDCIKKVGFRLTLQSCLINVV